MSKAPLDTLNDRVWYAWHCLPRRPNGQPPPWKPLEREYGIALATFQKLAVENRRSLDTASLAKVAAALHVTTDWLATGRGEPPKPTGPVPSRAERYALTDTLAELSAKAVAAGGVTSLTAPKNNLEMAIRTLIGIVRVDVIEAVVQESKGIEDTKPPHFWGRILLDRENAARAEQEKPSSEARPTRRPKPKSQPKRQHSSPPARRKVG